MSEFAEIYNKLPTVEDAAERFRDRTRLFEKLAPLLSQYNHEFGVCLVHAHCELLPGEKMVSSGYISSPKTDTACYPERWLDNGTAYEFSSVPTVNPPENLLKAFQDLVSDVGVLGLYYAGGPRKNEEVLLERTEGRDNITCTISANEVAGHLETAWLPGNNLGTGQPVTMACTIFCDSRATRNGTYHYGTKTHYQIQ